VVKSFQNFKFSYKKSSLKYFLHLAYKGTNYQGWQRQSNVISVQAVLEDKLSQMFKQKLTVHVCGRTDAGVHANQCFCHLIINEPWEFDAIFRLNKMLPPDIRVYEFIPVVAKANAQRDAISRTYDYYIHLKETPFLNELSTFYLIENPALIEMQMAAKLLTQYQDFRSFCKRPDLYPNTLCTVTYAELSINADNSRLHFRITANRFLRAMIRMIVGNLIELGRRKISLADFEQQLKHPKMATQPVFAYPQGLYLSKVVYPYLERAPQSTLPF